MKRKYLAFDIETASVHDGSDWRFFPAAGNLLCGNPAGDSDEPVLWHGGNDRHASRRPNEPAGGRRAGRIPRKTRSRKATPSSPGMGLGSISISWRKSRGCWPNAVALAVAHVDMMFHVFCQLGHGVGLDAAARGMGLAGKTEGMNGATAPVLWAEGRREEVLRYVAQDVRTTLELATTCEACGIFRWLARSGKVRSMALPKGWLAVRRGPLRCRCLIRRGWTIRGHGRSLRGGWEEMDVHVVGEFPPGTFAYSPAIRRKCREFGDFLHFRDFLLRNRETRGKMQETGNHGCPDTPGDHHTQAGVSKAGRGLRWSGSSHSQGVRQPHGPRRPLAGCPGSESIAPRGNGGNTAWKYHVR